MPELPEVETIRLGLEKYLVGKTITGVEVRLKKIFTGDPTDITGAKVTAVKRYGKGLVIELSNEYAIAVHIKLTGQLIYVNGVEKVNEVKRSKKVGGELPNKWTHVIFKLKVENGKLKNAQEHAEGLYYNDLRQFGWIKVIKTADLKTLPFFKDLGPEPFDGLTKEVFANIVKKGNIAIKVLLMDQKRIGGIGNIYANEALWTAKIDPRKKAKELTGKDTQTLYDAILQVLKKGLQYHGASELNFVDALGQDGEYQKHFLSYGQNGKKCQRCKTVIKKFFLGGRGTYFCPECQK